VDYEQGTVYRAVCLIQCIGNDASNIGISQSLWFPLMLIEEHVAKFGWKVLPQPLYSLNLVPSDFHMFRPIKDGLCRQHFPDDGLPLLEQIFKSTAHRLLVIATGKNITSGGD
jgi:hypothetical protein